MKKFYNTSLYQMLYFVQTVECGTYSKVSRKLNISQSALSKSIKAIERDLNIQLFFRDKNTLIPTEPGQALYHSWKKIIRQTEESVMNVHRFGDGEQGTLRIGVPDFHRSESYLWEYIEMFNDRYPNIVFNIEIFEADELYKYLQKNELDLIFMARYDAKITANNNCKTELVRECPLFVCMKQSHPLASKEIWEIEDLKECNLIMLSNLQVLSYNTMIVDLCTEYGFFPNIVYNAKSIRAMIYNLVQDNDVFILDQYHVNSDSDHIVIRPLKDTNSGVVMMWKNEEKEHLKYFIDTIRITESGRGYEYQ